MKKFIHWTIALPLLAAAISAEAQVFRMHGNILSMSGAPLTGGVRIMKHVGGTVVYSQVESLGNGGVFDVSWDAGFAGGTPSGELSLMYYPTGTGTNASTDPESNREVLELDFEEGLFWISPNSYAGDMMQSMYRVLPEENRKLCGLNIRHNSTLSTWHSNLSTGWCPGDYEKLNTIVQQSFPSGNLVSNGSFEGNTPNSATFEKWDVSGLDANIPNLYHAPGNLKPRTGKSMAGINFVSPPSGPQEQSFLKSNRFAVKPNTNYQLYFWVSVKNPVDWGSGGGIRPMVRNYPDRNGPENQDMTSGRVGASSYSISPDAWTPYFHEFTTGPSANFATVELLRTTSYGTGGVFYFEDVMVFEANSVLSPGDYAYKILNSTSFLNGTNKIIQTRLQNGNASVHGQIEYDELNRPVRSSLPVFGNFNTYSSPNGYFLNVFAQAHEQYNGWEYPHAEGYPFAESQFESSPLGRPSVQAFQGYEWRASGDHTLRSFFSSTTDLTPSSSEPPPASPSTANYAYELSKGEHNQLSRQFKDKFGRVVRSENSTSQTGGWVGTDYEYDANGNVSKVIPPAGQGGARVERTTKYNTLGKLISESSNDFGENRYMYDVAGRLRFTQSQAQRDNTPSRMDYVKYDALDRVIETGEFLNAAYFLPAFAEDADFPNAWENYRSVRTLNFYDRVPEVRRHCPDGIANRDFIIRSDAPPSSQTEFLTLEEAYDAVYEQVAGLESFSGSIRLIQVFDSPSDVVSPSLGRNFVPFQSYSGSQFYGFKILGVLRGPAYDDLVGGMRFPFVADWGPLHGRLVQTVSCNLDLVSEPSGAKQVSTVYNYDKYGNIKDVFEYNGYIREVGKQWQRTSQTFDAQNRLMARRIYPSASSLSPEVAFSYTYDNLGNLDEVTDINGAVIGKHYYNSIGQLTRLDVGQGAGQARISYTYHIRGWLKKVEALSPSGVRLFSQELKYEDEAPTYARYDGLVSSYEYATSPATPDKFTFLYGNLDRLSGAMTTAKAPGQTINPQWGYTYFDNGTLQTATREGQVFTYNYENTSVPGITNNTNRLNSVSFTGANLRNTSPVNTFNYDGSGRMQSDLSRDMGIQYSSNDLPYRFAYETGQNSYVQNMVYDGSGNRRSKLIFTNSNVFVSATHYTGSGKEIREFSNQPLQEIYPLDQFGRVVKNASGQKEYEAYLRNHLGSTVKIHNTSTNVESYRTDYDPYGKLRLQTSQTGIPVTSKFTGKEHDNGTELDYFGARYYDADLGVWISPDPVRGNDPSPYVYSNNDPINKIDPDGRNPALAQQAITIARVQGPIIARDATALARTVGARGEALVRDAYQIGEKSAVWVGGRLRIPDGLDKIGKVVNEVKNVKFQGLTQQLKDYISLAEEMGGRFQLFLRGGEQATKLSKPLQQAIEAGKVIPKEIPAGP